MAAAKPASTPKIPTVRLNLDVKTTAGKRETAMAVQNALRSVAGYGEAVVTLPRAAKGTAAPAAAPAKKAPAKAAAKKPAAKKSAKKALPSPLLDRPTGQVR